MEEDKPKEGTSTWTATEPDWRQEYFASIAKYRWYLLGGVIIGAIVVSLIWNFHRAKLVCPSPLAIQTEQKKEDIATFYSVLVQDYQTEHQPLILSTTTPNGTVEVGSFVPGNLCVPATSTTPS